MKKFAKYPIREDYWARIWNDIRGSACNSPFCSTSIMSMNNRVMASSDRSPWRRREIDEEKIWGEELNDLLGLG